MNRIINQLQMEHGYNKRVDGFKRGLIVDKEMHPTGNIEPMFGGMAKDEYALKVTVGVTFFSNSVQLEEARKVAERSLLSYLYGDTLNILQRAEQAVWDGDPEAALEAIHAIRNQITKP